MRYRLQACHNLPVRNLSINSGLLFVLRNSAVNSILVPTPVTTLFAATLFLVQVTEIAEAQFVNVAGAGKPAGQDVAVDGAKDGGLAWVDFNQDGCLDLLINTDPEDPPFSRLLFSDCSSDPSFVDVTATHAPGLELRRTDRSAITGDFNGDGYIDFATNSYTRIEIYFNGGPNASPPYRFGIGTMPNQIFSAWTHYGDFNVEGMAAMDVDADQDLDIVLDNNGPMLLVNIKGIFLEQEPTVSGFPALQGGEGDYLAAADFDVDGDTDVAVRRSGNFADLWTNTEGVFSGLDSTFVNKSKGGAIFCDFDMDGDFDLFWSHGTRNEVWRQDGPDVWVATGEPGSSSGVSLPNSLAIDGVSCADVDHDGDVDLYLSAEEADLLFVNDTPTGGALTFRQDNMGISNSLNSEGVVFGDYDNDGDMDLAVNIDGGPNELWRNETNDGNYLFVEAQMATGAPYNGATVLLRTGDGSGDFAAPAYSIAAGAGHGSGGDGGGKAHFGLRDGPGVVYEIAVVFPGSIVVYQCITPASLDKQTATISPQTPSTPCVDADQDGVADHSDLDPTDRCIPKGIDASCDVPNTCPDGAEPTSDGTCPVKATPSDSGGCTAANSAMRGFGMMLVIVMAIMWVAVRWRHTQL